jgi:pyridoxine 5-phosphate synthase
VSTRLSVNLNKVATLRNSRGGNNPDLLRVAKDVERFGAQGITVHPRPDERHIRYADVRALSKLVTTELNIEGNPSERKFIDLVLETRPAQVTLVPDAVGQLTSDHGWDTVTHHDALVELVKAFKKAEIRVSLFVDPVVEMVEGARRVGADRVELYTEAYAKNYATDPESAVVPYVVAADRASSLGLGLNAGHDLDLINLRTFRERVPALLEVSIGHALICDALYLGLEETIRRYRALLV